MKKALLILTAAFSVSSLTSLKAVDASTVLNELYGAHKISESCFTCVKDTLSTVESSEIQCLINNINLELDIAQIIAAFQTCTQTELDLVKEKCKAACDPKTPSQTQKK